MLAKGSHFCFLASPIFVLQFNSSRSGNLSTFHSFNCLVICSTAVIKSSNILLCLQPPPSRKEKYSECFTAMWSVLLLLCESKLQLVFWDVMWDGKVSASSLLLIHRLCLLTMEVNLVPFGAYWHCIRFVFIDSSLWKCKGRVNVARCPKDTGRFTAVQMMSGFLHLWTYKKKGILILLLLCSSPSPLEFWLLLSNLEKLWFRGLL